MRASGLSSGGGRYMDRGGAENEMRQVIGATRSLHSCCSGVLSYQGLRFAHDISDVDVIVFGEPLCTMLDGHTVLETAD